VDFIIVVNPASGPGSGPLPDREFTREITRLNRYPNVRTIGYVAVDYGKKPPEKALADMDKYASWPTLNPNLAMQGIFLDESPQLADASNTTYMERVRAKVKSLKELSAGLLGTLIRFPPALFVPVFFRCIFTPTSYTCWFSCHASSIIRRICWYLSACPYFHGLPFNQPTIPQDLRTTRKHPTLFFKHFKANLVPNLQS
jgi:hypothetical protein